MPGLSLHDTVLVIYLGYLLLLSIITFIMYFVDKQKAKNGSWRIKEATLLIMSILGGAFGGYPSMLIFRHKTAGEHWYFTFVNILGILIHVAVLIALFFFIKF